MENTVLGLQSVQVEKIKVRVFAESSVVGITLKLVT